MLNIKKGLAVALAAATVLTFAPTSVFAGTTAATKREDAVDSKGNHTNIAGGLKTTMNESANVWSYDNSSLTGSAALSKEQTAYVVLTPSNPEGSVTFTENITSSDYLSTGKWFTNMTTTGGASETANNKEAEGILELTAGKNSKTLNIRASVAKLRELTHPVYYTVNPNTSSALATDTKVTVILKKDAVKMNNLKVVMGTASDSAHDRYVKHGADEYDAFEARPTGVGSNDITTKDDVDVALDGVKISKKTLNLADSSKDTPFKSVESNAEVTYKSDDTNIATVDKDGIHAKAVGNTTVYISTKQSLTAYGEVTVKIPVEVINKPAATLSAPDDIYVHGLDKENEVTIGATGTNIQKNSIKYAFVHWNAVKQDWEDYTSYAGYNGAQRNPFKLDETKDAVYVLSYTGDDDDSYDWGAYLKVTATAAAGYTGPAPKYVRLHFVQNSNLFKLDAYKQELHVGGSVQITTKSVTAVSGAAFSYKSINPAVATVSDTGVIKAVSEGSTQVEVSYGGGKQYVEVKVTNYENGNGSVKTPAKVTGVKVTNLKGGKVKVTWTKSSNANVKYYVKKIVGKKSAGKSVGSNKTTLSVKKGATVKVKVKAYVYDESGNKLVGTYSKTVTKKTDRK